MADLAQALSEIKSLPDIALRHALSKPDGTIPGFLALSELHERKRIRASAGGSPAERPSMAQEYMGMETARTGFASGGVVPKGMDALTNPNMMYYEAATNPRSMYNRPGKGGIVDLVQPGTPVDPSGLESLVPRQPNQPGMPGEPQHYARGGIVALDNYRRQGVDPRIYDILSRAAARSPYEVRLISGEREGDPRYHGQGKATDIQLYDPETGQALENYQSGKHFKEYKEYADQTRAIQQELYPDMPWRWGGYFSGPKGKYGAMDLMHFDTGTTPMAGGSWESGLTPEQAQLYGIQQQQGGQGGTPDWAAIQNSIANIESAGSGGYSAVGPDTKGDRPYGRYQIMGNNIGPWTQQYLGTRMTADQFLANQQAQDAVFQGQFGQYVNKYGLQGAAQAWFGGPGSVGKTGGTDILGTSVGEYGQRFMAGLNANNPTAMASAATSGASGAVAQAAANTGAEMAAADGGMGDFMMLAQLMGGGGQKAPAPMGGGAPQQPQAPINPEDMYRRGVTMPGMRRSAYG